MSRTLRFGIVGILAAGVHLSVAMAMLRFAGFVPTLANMTGFCVAFVFSLIGQTFFTFRHRLSPKVAAKFMAVALFTLLCSTVTVWAATHLLLAAPAIATASGAVCAPVFNYLLNTFWTYRRREATSQ